ncbi:MAG TPA: amidohydrolase family protein, partial [Gammaproteobacteria bacterium]|nr:amidohydrolase family protein [Gammaproteobacteria bacterium]
MLRNLGYLHSALPNATLMLLGAVLAACTQPAPEEASTTPEQTSTMPAASTATVFEGARVIVGNGDVIENAIFVVDNGEFGVIGPAASVSVPAGAARVDLSGRTVMPAILDAHVHMSLNLDGLLTDLRQRAVMGVAGALSMGRDADDALLDLRGNEPAGSARFFTAGRGISRPEPGRPDEPHWISTPEEGRAAVREEAARGVDVIKVWVDDRNGQYEKLTPELYGAIIDEAHIQGLRVAAHIFTLEDAKGLARAGIDIFAHGVRDRDIDDEFVELVRGRPELIMVPNLPERGVPTDLGWLDGLMPADQLAALRAENTTDPDLQEFYGIQARNLARLDQAGLRIAMGTDGNVYWGAHIEMEDMVAAGMSPADVIVAATANSATVMGITDAGTIESGKRAD